MAEVYFVLKYAKGKQYNNLFINGCLSIPFLEHSKWEQENFAPTANHAVILSFSHPQHQFDWKTAAKYFDQALEKHGYDLYLRKLLLLVLTEWQTES
jgi:hypothetical protein